MRRKGKEKRQRLVEATSELLRERSLAKLRVADIVRVSGTSPPNFYLYFGGVLDAVLAAVEQVSMCNPQILVLVQEPWPSGELQQRARKFVESYIAHWRRFGHILRVRSVMVSEGDSRFIAAEEAASVPILLSLASKFEPAGSTGPYVSPRAASMAGVILAMLDRLAAYRPAIGVNPFGITPEELIDRATSVINLAVREAQETEP